REAMTSRLDSALVVTWRTLVVCSIAGPTAGCQDDAPADSPSIVIDLFTLFTLRLDAAGIDDMVTGSVASMVCGEPRLTHDVDLVLALPLESVPALVDAFPGDAFYCPPAEVMRLEIARV